jgi:hypothetical protein
MQDRGNFLFWWLTRAALILRLPWATFDLPPNGAAVIGKVIKRERVPTRRQRAVYPMTGRLMMMKASQTAQRGVDLIS